MNLLTFKYFSFHMNRTGVTTVPTSHSCEDFYLESIKMVPGHQVDSLKAFFIFITFQKFRYWPDTNV